MIGCGHDAGQVPGHDIDLMRAGKCYSVNSLNQRHAERILRDRFHDAAGTRYAVRSEHAFCEVDYDPYAPGEPKVTFFFDLGSAIAGAWPVALVAAMLYAMGWSAWQGVRWVARGFRKV